MGLFRLAQVAFTATAVPPSLAMRDVAILLRRESSFCHVALSRSLERSWASSTVATPRHELLSKVAFYLTSFEGQLDKEVDEGCENFLTWTTVSERRAAKNTLVHHVVLHNELEPSYCQIIMSKSPNHHKYKSKLSTGSFKGKFTYQDSQPPNARTAHNLPSISLTSSSGSSSLLHSEDSTPSSSRSSSLNKIAKGASDIQHYASRYIDSIKTKSFSSQKASRSPHRSTSNSSSRSESPLYGGSTSSVPYLLTFRQAHRLTPTTPVSTTPSSLLPPRPYSLTPSPPPSLSASPKKSSESR